VELDRQSIEKRDFPIGRRGYDPAAVDAHLRALATEVEELRRTLEHRAGESLGSSAGTQVQGILEAAEATAADIEQKASEDARQTRAEADSNAERTRANAVERAQAHVAAVAQATAVLIERVESMDGEASTLVESLRAGAGRLSSELMTVETNMAELYDAAAGRGSHAPQAGSRQEDLLQDDSSPTTVPAGDAVADVPVRQGHSEFVPTTAPAPTATPVASVPPPSTPAAGSPATPPLPFSEQSPPTPSESNRPQASADNGEGARLIALNMALNGDSRAATDRYLAEHYQLTDRQQLLDEVYAVIEG
jgi:F0F1-type ATP synthase membrane subunit b/b'